MAEFSVPVVVEVILERVTNVSTGVEIDAVTEFEDLATSGADAPTAGLTARLADTDRHVGVSWCAPTPGC